MRTRISTIRIGLAILWIAAAGLPTGWDTHADAAVPNDVKVYEWLLLQQGPLGILGNQEEDDFAGLYTNAVAALCYLHQGDVPRAERIFSFFAQYVDSVAEASPGGFCQFWDARTGQPHLDTDRWVGDNAWLLIALNTHYQMTGRTTFAQMRRTIGDWIVRLQDVDGGIRSGFSLAGPMDWKSTEGNLDCYAALIDYPRERKRIGSFLQSKMWIPAEGRFRMGSTTAESALDCCSWGMAALGAHFAQAMRYAEATFSRQEVCQATGNLVQGFSDFVAWDRIWLEGTGQMAVAYHVAGQHEQAQQVLAELDQALMPSARWAGTVGLASHTNDPAWATGATTIFVPSQAWYLFATWQYNPMADPRDPNRTVCVVDFNGDGWVDFKDFSELAGSWRQPDSKADVAPKPWGDGRVDFKDLALLAENWLTRQARPPTIRLTGPLDGSEVWVGAAVQMQAEASGAGASVVRVEFLVDADMAGEDTDGTDGWATTWTPSEAGLHLLAARAIDEEGRWTASASVLVTARSASR
jgi:hypothetical protein